MGKHSVELTKEQDEALEALCKRYGWSKRTALKKGLEALDILTDVKDHDGEVTYENADGARVLVKYSWS